MLDTFLFISDIISRSFLSLKIKISKIKYHVMKQNFTKTDSMDNI